MNERLNELRAWHVDLIRDYEKRLSLIEKHSVRHFSSVGDSEPTEITDKIISRYKSRIASSKNMIAKIDSDYSHG